MTDADERLKQTHRHHKRISVDGKHVVVRRSDSFESPAWHVISRRWPDVETKRYGVIRRGERGMIWTGQAGVPVDSRVHFEVVRL